MDTPKISELGRTYLENLSAIEAGRNAMRADAHAVMRAVEYRASKWKECETEFEGSSVVVRWPYEEKAADILKVEVRLTWEGDRGWPEITLNEHLDMPWKSILPRSMFVAQHFDETERKALMEDPVGVCFAKLEHAVDDMDDLVENDDDLWLRYSVRQMLRQALDHVAASDKLPKGGYSPNLRGDDADWPCRLEWWSDQIGRNWVYWNVLFIPGPTAGEEHRLLLLGNQVADPNGLDPYPGKYFVVKDLGQYLRELEKADGDDLPDGIAERLASEVLEEAAAHSPR